MSNEGNLWTRVRNHIGYMGHFNRLEFNPVAGIPDVDFCIRGVEGKIELKYEKAPARDGTAVFGARTARGMRDEQVGWYRMRRHHGGRCFILAQVGERLYLIHGDMAPVFNELTVPQFEALSLWKGGPTLNEYDWKHLAVVLTAPWVNFEVAERVVGQREPVEIAAVEVSEPATPRRGTRRGKTRRS